VEVAKPLKCTIPGCSDPRADQDPEATNRHCLAHRAFAHRDWNRKRLEQERGTAFVEGVEEFRKILVAEFAKFGSSEIPAITVAKIIFDATGPICRSLGGKNEKQPDKGKPARGTEPPFASNDHA
jgi:hypothetical protein